MFVFRVLRMTFLFLLTPPCLHVCPQADHLSWAPALLLPFIVVLQLFWISTPSSTHPFIVALARAHMLQTNHNFRPSDAPNMAVSPALLPRLLHVDGSPDWVWSPRFSLDAWVQRETCSSRLSCFYANLPPVLLFIHPAQSMKYFSSDRLQHPRATVSWRHGRLRCSKNQHQSSW